MEPAGIPLRIAKGNRLALGVRVLQDGDKIMVRWQGRWMTGRFEYVWWRHAHRLWCGECSIDIAKGMVARWVIEEAQHDKGGQDCVA